MHWFSFLTMWITSQRATCNQRRSLAASTHGPERSAAFKLNDAFSTHPPAYKTHSKTLESHLK